jgi:hypothetical protein
MMPISPVFPALVLAAIASIAAGCERADTSAAPVTTTSPAGSSTAPSSSAAKARDHALIRVVDAVPSGTNFDLFAGDLIVFDGVGFKSVSSYRALDGKRYAFSLRPTGMPNSTPLSSNTENLNDGAYYTAFAIPEDGRGPRLRIVEDDLHPPAAGKARLRVVHGGSGAGAMTLRATGAADSLYDAVDYQAVTGYKDVSTMNGAIEILVKGQPVAAVTVPNARLEAGRHYTLVIVGSAPKLEAFLIEDALTP